MGNQHDRVARDHGRREGVDDAEEGLTGLVGGGIRHHDAAWFGDREVEVGACDRIGLARQLCIFIGPAGKPHPFIDCSVHLCGGCAGTDPFTGPNLGDELLPPALQHLGDPIEHLAAVITRGTSPTRLGRPGCRHRITRVFPTGLGDVGEVGAFRSAHRQRVATLASGKLPPDVELVGLFHIEPGHFFAPGPVLGRR